MTSVSLPIVDFSLLNIANVDNDEAEARRENNKLKPLVDEVMTALREMRFCYLKNTGLSLKKIDRQLETTKEVMALPKETKLSFAGREGAILHRYVNREIERPDDVKSVETFEAFLVCPRMASFWPEDVPQFKTASLDVFSEYAELSNRVFDIISIGLNLQDKRFLRDSHKEDHATLRSAFYPRYPDEFVPQPGQTRFFQHCDVGTVSFVYQDSNGGLEAQTPDGDWFSLPHIPGTVLLLTGQLMQIWTANELTALLHRVAIPQNLEDRRTDRQSLTFFPLPPDDFVFRCLDGSNKYDPITTKEFCLKRLIEAEYGEL